MSKSFPHSPIDAELQVRLMNLVLGEASDFERDQLQSLMEDRPELIAYYQHLEHLHGLLSQVAAGEPVSDDVAPSADELWQLPADKRNQLLAVLDGQSPIPSGQVSSFESFLGEPLQLPSWTSTMLVLAVVALLMVGLMLPAVQSSREAARRDASQWNDNEATEMYSYMGGESHSQTEAKPHSAQAPESAGRRMAGADSIAIDALPEVVELKSDVKKSGAVDDFMAQTRSQHAPVAPVAPAKPGEPRFRKGFDDSSNLSFEAPKETLDQRGYFGMQPGDAASTTSAVPAHLNQLRSLWTGIEGDAVMLADIAQNNESARWDRYGIELPNVGADVAVRSVTPGFIVAPEEASMSILEGRDRSSTATTEESKGKADAAEPPIALGRTSVPGTNSAMFSDVQLEYIEDLDMVIVKGAARDVERTQELIEDLKTQEKGVEVVLGFSPADGEQAGQQQAGQQQAGQQQAGQQQAGQQQAGQQQSGQQQSGEQQAGEQQSGQQRELNGALGSLLKRRMLSRGTEKNVEAEVREKVSAGKEHMLEQVQNPTSKSAPAPRPEVALSTRDRDEVERKEVERFSIRAKRRETIDEQSAATEAFSTFSLHVSDVSFKLAQAALAQGQWPEAAKIRIEEFVNALDYHDPLPKSEEKIACRIEQAIHPTLMQRNLLRVSLRTAAAGRAQNSPLRLTLLLDNSGSMERADRRQAVLRAFQALTSQLTAADQITLISFASTPRLLADKVPGNQGERLQQLVDTLPSEGGTNIEAALLLAREKALEQKLAGGQNRIVLLTDGAVNLGDANPDTLAKLVIQLRDAGIAFDAAGISALDLNDDVLEALTRQGDGRYYLLNSGEAVSENFAAQIAGALRPSAQNVKVQVEFNPQRVGRYKLLGFEKHRLNKEDFRNDKVDAAEMAAAEAGVALYHYEVKPGGSGDVGSVSVRFRDLATGQMIERRWPIPYESSTPRLEQAGASMQMATSAALLAAKLSGGALADSVDLAQLQKLLTNLPDQYAGQPRVQQLRAMIEQAIAIQK